MQKQEIPEDADNGEFHSRAEQESKPVRGNGKKASPNRKAKVVDPILPEKKRARRRLIGAVALVLAAVIGLPMVLDSEPKPNVDDINIQIPSKDKAPALSEHNGVVQATNPALVNSKSKPIPAEPVEEIITPLTNPPSDTNNKPVASSAKSEQKIATPKTESVADNKPIVPVATKPSVKASASAALTIPASKTQSKSETADEAARALAILEGKTAVKAAANKAENKAEKTEKNSSGYIIQVAALATQEKVNELQAALKAANIQSHSQKVVTVSGQVTRIRVGPFDSKDEAEKMQAKLIKAGLSGKILPN